VAPDAGDVARRRGEGRADLGDRLRENKTAGIGLVG
jgi:hypothetical protein